MTSETKSTPKKVLYLLKSCSGNASGFLIEQDADISSRQVKVVLIQDAVGLEIKTEGLNCYVLENNLGEGHASLYSRINYSDLVDMIFDSDTVISW